MKTISKNAGSKPRRGAASPKRTSGSGVNTESAGVPLRIKSILVPIDFSELSKKALDYAVAFAAQFGARLTLLHVLEPVTGPGLGNLAPLVMENDKLVADRKARLDKLAKQRGISPKIVEKLLVRCGRSFVEVADAARTLKIDLIIIATHGFTGLKHTFLGSTTERVVRYAPCPVLVVRETQPH